MSWVLEIENREYFVSKRSLNNVWLEFAIFKYVSDDLVAKFFLFRYLQLYDLNSTKVEI
jgi:hypothetical protein